jgi:class 3 adenylate cyclase
MMAVLCAEIRGFTRISEILEPAVVIARIAEFFTMVAAAVEGHDGSVRSRLNDNLVATFTGTAGAMHAVEAAQQIQRDFNAIEEAWQRDYGFRTAVAMGLHCGNVVIGGLESPPQVLTIGDGLSLAERLLHRARAGEFVLSKALMDTLASSGGSVEAEPLPALKVRDREPLQIYGVLLDTRLDFTN